MQLRVLAIAAMLLASFVLAQPAFANPGIEFGSVRVGCDEGVTAQLRSSGTTAVGSNNNRLVVWRDAVLTGTFLGADDQFFTATSTSVDVTTNNQVAFASLEDGQQVVFFGAWFKPGGLSAEFTENRVFVCSRAVPRASVHGSFSIDGGPTNHLTVYRAWGAGGSEFGCEWDASTPLGVAPDGSFSFSIWSPHIHADAMHGVVFEFGRDGGLWRGCSLVNVPMPWLDYSLGNIELRTIDAVRIGDAG